MLRGFRWPFIVLVMAILLFSASLVTRLSQSPATPLPTNAPPPTPLPTLPTPQQAAVIQPATPAAVSTFREAEVGQVQRLNPLFASLNPVDQDITSLIFEGLTRTDEYGEIIPALAKTWVISSDGLEYVVQLREDVLWQDGIPFTAADVIYTVSLLRSPDFPGDEKLAAFWRTVETQQLGDYLIRFRLTQPLGSFLDALRIGMLPEHALYGTTAAQLADHPFNLSPIGTGPYQLEALRSTDGQTIDIVDLRVAPVFRQRPEGQDGYAIDRVRFQLYDTFEAALSAFQSGEADGLAAPTRHERPPLLATPNANVQTALAPTLGIVIFNWAEHAYFREQRVRQALMTGLDRAPILERLLPNLVVKADSPLLPGSWAYTPDLPWPLPNVDTARELLATANIQPGDNEAEATEEPNGGLLNFTILTPDDPALISVAQEIAAQWSQLSINVSVESANADEYQRRLDEGEFDVALVEFSLGDSADPDIYTFWDEGQYPDGKNYGGVSDRRISEALERARRDPDGTNRIIYYHSFQRNFIERAVAIPLYYPLFTYATSQRMSGVQLGVIGLPSDRFYTLKDWTIAES
ncbi:MAG: peptide ABC transporter substrate-binding protein [Anaerolineaceae bacterium]|nr:peptide ABC transporter substrate-binding protein [Anaerolineaceae bacterium]